MQPFPRATSVAGYREEGQGRKIDGGKKFSHTPEPCCLVVWLSGLRTAIAMLGYMVHIYALWELH
jgi:hypothetical protein